MKNLYKTIKYSFTVISILLLMITGRLLAQVYTPNCTAVDYITITNLPGEVALLEAQASAYIANRGWTTTGSNPDIIKTGVATNEYNCHSYA